MITVDLRGIHPKICSDGIEITGLRNITIEYTPGGHKRLTAHRFQLDESGRHKSEFGAVFEQSLEFRDFEVIA